MRPLERRMEATPRYWLQGPIGQGSFGSVWAAIDQRSRRQQVAIKMIHKVNDSSSREKALLELIDHPNVVSLRDSFLTLDDGRVYQNLVFPLADSDLKTWIRRKSMGRKPSLCEKTIKAVFYQSKRIYVEPGREIYHIYPIGVNRGMFTQIASGLAHIHSLNIVHRDLKPSNILITNNPTLTAMLSDFGSARLHGSGDMLTHIGTKSHRSPELLFGVVRYNTSIDVWSLGVVLVELLIGGTFLPDEEMNALSEAGSEMNFNLLPDWPKYCMRKFVSNNAIIPVSKLDLLVDLLDKPTSCLPLHPTKESLETDGMLTWTPKTRLSAEQVLNHSYLKP